MAPLSLFISKKLTQWHTHIHTHVHTPVLWICSIAPLLFYAKSLKLDRTHRDIFKWAVQGVLQKWTLLHLGKCWWAAVNFQNFLYQNFLSFRKSIANRGIRAAQTLWLRWVTLAASYNLCSTFKDFFLNKLLYISFYMHKYQCRIFLCLIIVLIMRIISRYYQSRVGWRGGRIRILSRSFSWVAWVLHCPGKVQIL